MKVKFLENSELDFQAKETEERGIFMNLPAKNKAYPWLVCLMCTLLLSCCMGVTNGTFSVFSPYLTEGGLTHTQASMILTIRNIFGVSSMMFVTNYYSKVGLRRGMAIAILIGASAFVLYGFASSFPVYCTAAAISGISYGWGGIIPASLMLNRWFKEHRTLALGISGSGTGVAMLILPIILNTIITKVSVRAAFWFDAGLMITVAVLLYLVVRDTPQELHMHPLGETEQQKAERVHFGTGLGKIEMAGMMLAMLFLGICTQPGVNHLPVYYAEIGFDSVQASLAISVIGGALIVGKCLYGYLVDKFGSYQINAVFYVILLGGLVFAALASTGKEIFIYLSSIMIGSGTTLTTVGMMTMAQDLETKEHYGKASRNFQVIHLAGVLSCSSVPGIVADLTGSYLPVYVVAPVLEVISGVIVLGIYRRHRSDKARKLFLNCTGN